MPLDSDEILKIDLYRISDGSGCRVTNFKTAKNTLLARLHEFILERKGRSFRDSSGQFWMPIRYTAEGMEDLLKRLGIDAKVTEPNSIENKTSKAINKATETVNWREAKVGFGKYKETKWKDVPDDYLKWACKNLDEGASKSIALKELGHRKG